MVTRSWAVVAAVAVVTGVMGCANGGPPGEVQRAFVEPVRQAHGIEAWWDTEGVMFDAVLTRSGGEELALSFIMETNGPRVRMERSDGVVVVYDGETAWQWPADAEFPRARFHVLTWPWFLVMPFKLGGPGSQLELLEPLPLDGEPHPAAKWTFDAGEGDAPQDWYVVYADPETHALVASGYIVTYGVPVDAAEQDPHAIVYGGFETMDGVTLSTDWTFYGAWSQKEGPHGGESAAMEISDVRFVIPQEHLFEPAAEARELELPVTRATGGDA